MTIRPNEVDLSMLVNFNLGFYKMPNPKIQDPEPKIEPPDPPRNPCGNFFAKNGSV